MKRAIPTSVSRSPPWASGQGVAPEPRSAGCSASARAILVTITLTLSTSAGDAASSPTALQVFDGIVRSHKRAKSALTCLHECRVSRPAHRTHRQTGPGYRPESERRGKGYSKLVVPRPRYLRARCSAR